MPIALMGLKVRFSHNISFEKRTFLKEFENKGASLPFPLSLILGNFNLG